MQVQTLKAHRYAEKQRKPGDLYHVKDADVRLLRALGWVGDVQPAAKTTAVQFAETVSRQLDRALSRPAYLPAVQAEDKPKRTYRRRDMVAKFTDQE